MIAQQIRGALDELRRPVPVLLISADPAADTPARVRRFLPRVSLSGRVRYLTRLAGAAASGLARLPGRPGERRARAPSRARAVGLPDRPREAASGSSSSPNS